MKIEVPANRYDLLCLEGIVRALKLYLNPEIGAPSYRLKPAPKVREHPLCERCARNGRKLKKLGAGLAGTGADDHGSSRGTPAAGEWGDEAGSGKF